MSYTADRARLDAATRPYYSVPKCRNLSDILQAIRHLALSGKVATQIEYTGNRKYVKKLTEELTKRKFVVRPWLGEFLWISWSDKPTQVETVKAQLIERMEKL